MIFGGGDQGSKVGWGGVAKDITHQSTAARTGYKQGSCVRPLDQEYVKMVHQQSFGHRNRRTYIIVVPDPQQKAADVVLEAEVRAG